MLQQTKEPTAVTCSQGSGTGPGAEASTPPLTGIDYGNFNKRDSSVVVMLQIQRDRIAIVATLDMGGLHTVTRTWSMESPGVWRTRQPEFAAAEERIGIELAEYLDALHLPTLVAVMLPKPPTAVGITAMEEAAREVRHA